MKKFSLQHIDNFRAKLEADGWREMHSWVVANPTMRPHLAQMFTYLKQGVLILLTVTGPRSYAVMGVISSVSSDEALWHSLQVHFEWYQRNMEKPKKA